MPPNTTSKDIIPTDTENCLDNLVSPQAGPRKYKIVYRNIIVFLYYHVAGLYGLYLCFTEARWQTLVVGYATFWLAGTGVVAGSHRLWAHKSYKATKPLQVFLMLCHSVANQHSVLHWVRDHRLHHKYSDTDADPHNATRGFFYSHVGWLLVRKHPEVKRRGQLIDMSDIYSTPVLMFQHRNSSWFIPLLSFVIPTTIPVLCWSETIAAAWHVNMLRYMLNLNVTFLVNSYAHIWGYRPYDKTISPAENRAIAVLTLGDGFHNFHHVFPWDYRSSEFSSIKWNMTTVFINVCAWLGLAYDLKKAPDDMIQTRAKRTGDGSNVW